MCTMAAISSFLLTPCSSDQYPSVSPRGPSSPQQQVFQLLVLSLVGTQLAARPQMLLCTMWVTQVLSAPKIPADI
jgi:hypothetical protein